MFLKNWLTFALLLTSTSCAKPGGPLKKKEDVNANLAGNLSCGEILHSDIQTRVRYLSSSSSSCESEKETQFRVCSNGAFSQWTGTYDSESCETKKECDGQVHGTIRHQLAYTANEALDCSTVKETQTSVCQDGTWGPWEGKGTYSSCTSIEKCGEYTSGTAQIRERFDPQLSLECKFFKQKRTCEMGKWTEWIDESQVKDCSAFKSCNGGAHDEKQMRTNVVFEENTDSCSSITGTQARVCNNGTWGDWRKETESCKEYKSCGNINHGGVDSRVRYESKNSKDCKSEIQIRSCIDGKFNDWIGENQAEACTLIEVKDDYTSFLKYDFSFFGVKKQSIDKLTPRSDPQILNSPHEIFYFPNEIIQVVKNSTSFAVLRNYGNVSKFSVDSNANTTNTTNTKKIFAGKSDIIALKKDGTIEILGSQNIEQDKLDYINKKKVANVIIVDSKSEEFKGQIAVQLLNNEVHFLQNQDTIQSKSPVKQICRIDALNTITLLENGKIITEDSAISNMMNQNGKISSLIDCRFALFANGYLKEWKESSVVLSEFLEGIKIVSIATTNDVDDESIALIEKTSQNQNYLHIWNNTSIKSLVDNDEYKSVISTTLGFAALTNKGQIKVFSVDREYFSKAENEPYIQILKTNGGFAGIRVQDSEKFLDHFKSLPTSQEETLLNASWSGKINYSYELEHKGSYSLLIKFNGTRYEL